ncbi:MAG TPA: ion transporter [Thermoanaerobaculia bacterium]|nr:ion transporter [Thermoanaerobaculia bacterium]
MHSVDTQRVRLLVQFERVVERPIILLSLLWVVIAVVELTRGLSRGGQIAATTIWIIFLVDFVVKLIIAPRKRTFLKRNWLVALSLLVPAFRLFRFARAFRLLRVTRGIRVAKLLGSINRGLRALRRTLKRHAAGYVGAATLLVLLAGAAGMMVFESEGPNRAAFQSYASSVWWTAMLMTTIASESWPRTGAGRALTLFLSLYSIAVFGYVTATLASFFVTQNREEGRR